VVDGVVLGFLHGKGHQWTLFVWIYAQFGLGSQVELEGVPVASGSQLCSGGCKRCKGHKRG
jgi:hypothetical protein